MPIHNPLPTSLRAECQKAAQILREFTIPSATSGPDSLIPKSILSTCRGIAILSVFKLGFLVTARGGSGVVIAKLSDGSWSAPSALSLGGIGGGFELGVELTDFVIILNTHSAVDSFRKGSNVTLGGNMTVALGPLGRNVEADVSLRNAASFYTYSKSRGLFAGISLEGSFIGERKSANRKLYGGEVRARDLLAGSFPPPDEARVLYEALEYATGDPMAGHPASHDIRRFSNARSIGRAAGGGNPRPSARPTASKSSSSGSGGGSGGNSKDSGSKDSKDNKESGGKDSGSSGGGGIMSKLTGGGRKSSASQEEDYKGGYGGVAGHFDAPVMGYTGALNRQNWSPKNSKKSIAAYNVHSVDWSESKCKALYAFAGERECDLVFREGAVITILTRTDKQEDWWEGRLEGRVGIFPANYVQLV